VSRKLCTSPLELAQLIAYQMGELSAREQEAVEEHYFGCEDCSQRLQGLVQLGEAIVRAVRAGELSAPVTASLLERAAADGLLLRQYSVHPGETVACTASPEDDFVVIHLAGSLSAQRSVSMRIETEDLEHGGRQVRELPTVPVDQDRGELFLLFAGSRVRSYPRSRWTMQLGAPGQEPDASLGTFTLEHTPWELLPEF
jgi:hypothetical protein